MLVLDSKGAGCLFRVIALAIGLTAASPIIAQDQQTYRLTDGNSVAELEHFRECDHCLEMIVMRLGSFMMGAIEGESRNPFDFYGANTTGRIRGPDEINNIRRQRVDGGDGCP